MTTELSKDLKTYKVVIKEGEKSRNVFLTEKEAMNLAREAKDKTHVLVSGEFIQRKNLEIKKTRYEDRLPFQILSYLAIASKKLPSF